MKQGLVKLVWNRAENRCEYCHFPYDIAWLPFQIDHIISEKHGGPTLADNLALSCYYCNSFKGPNIAGIDPDGAKDNAVQLFHPRRNIWAEHFAWNDAVLIGTSACGRTTIVVLRINESNAIETRSMLIDSGYHL